MKTIIGMPRWMFWTLLAVSIFALAGPELAAIARGGEPPKAAVPAIDQVTKERDDARAQAASSAQTVATLQSQVTQLNDAVAAIQGQRNQLMDQMALAGITATKSDQQLRAAQERIAQLEKELAAAKAPPLVEPKK